MVFDIKLLFLPTHIVGYVQHLAIALIKACNLQSCVTHFEGSAQETTVDTKQTRSVEETKVDSGVQTIQAPSCKS